MARVISTLVDAEVGSGVRRLDLGSVPVPDTQVHQGARLFAHVDLHPQPLQNAALYPQKLQISRFLR